MAKKNIYNYYKRKTLTKEEADSLFKAGGTKIYNKTKDKNIYDGSKRIKNLKDASNEDLIKRSNFIEDRCRENLEWCQENREWKSILNERFRRSNIKLK